MFLSLKHPVRRKILRILSVKPCTFTEILQQINIESAHLSYHLESLGDLTTKVEEGKYSLSEIGRAAVSVMQKVEEPEKHLPPRLARVSKRLRIARISSLFLMVFGITLLLVGLFAFAPANYRSVRVQKGMDTDSWYFMPNNVISYGGYLYLGDGFYGIEIDLVFNESYRAMFPLVVRLCTPSVGLETSDYWNKSWYEWSTSTILSVSGMRERLSVTILVQGSAATVVSQETFDHVHSSPGRTIGQFSPADSIVLIKVAPELANLNVTLEGFRAFQITWLYFPVPENKGQETALFSSLILIASSAVFIIVSENLIRKE
jgi:DNA-binding transcriptional ArsR family regulator